MTAYWMVEEIDLHDLRRVFPDWGELAIRYMEGKRRDNAAAYSRRRSNELKYKKEYRQRTEVKAAHAKRNREKCVTNPGFRIRRRLSRRLGELMSGWKNGMSVLRFVGCSQDELKRHIETQFLRWMTWENYGAKWHIDHIIPCAAFDHTDPNQVAACWHWTNLRPLCAKENAAKKDRITLPQMKLRLELCA